MECLLDVSAVSTADLISVAGGWLCDRAMAGWTVTVWAPKLDHARSLAILGVTARELADPSDGEVDALALHGAPQEATARHRPDCVRHRVSAAARAFKARALLAAGLPPSTLDLEIFVLGGSSKLLASRDFLPISTAGVAP